jgi:hypothetical protein
MDDRRRRAQNELYRTLVVANKHRVIDCRSRYFTDATTIPPIKSENTAGDGLFEWSTFFEREILPLMLLVLLHINKVIIDVYLIDQHDKRRLHISVSLIWCFTSTIAYRTRTVIITMF